MCTVFGDEEAQVSVDRSSAVAQDFFEKCFHGDVAAAAELLDPKVSFHVPGSHQLAGTFEGPQAVTEHVEELLQQTHHSVDVLQWEDWMVGVNDLAGLVKLRVQREGSIGIVRAVFLLAMSREGRIKRIELFFSNLAEVERLFV